MNEEVQSSDASERTVFSTIPEAIEDIRAGKIVLVVDDADRENEGDFIMAAEAATPEAVNFMVTHGRGIVCLPCAAWRLDELGIQQMVTEAAGGHEAAFSVSIDFRHDTTTGTSAQDRAVTAKAVTDPQATARDFRKPGHVFPLRAKEGGVLRRAGHTEASVDLAEMAGMFPAGVICEVMKEDGSMARMPDLIAVAKEHGLKLISIADMIEYRRHREVLVKPVAEADIPTPYGEFRSHAYESLVDGRTHIALVRGDGGGRDGPHWFALIRSALRATSSARNGAIVATSSNRAMANLSAREGRGVVLYVRGSRGSRHRAHPQAPRLSAPGRSGMDTVEANERLGFPPTSETMA